MLSTHIFEQNAFDLKLLISILPLVFLIASNSATYFASSDKIDISFATEQISSCTEEVPEKQENDILELELAAYLVDCPTAPSLSLKKPASTFFSIAHFPPHRSYDNPPPEC